ncbi:MAG TPA: ABC transporter ATP-binding protein [Candidatus Limnocylindrales bacterium]|nr:ABC transporter ATP-binding protein [Candidatus Limnocylindrales bacterium]
MLTIKGLNSGYGKLQVLYDLSMEVPSKGITVVVGPNGAGKTTLLCSIMGIANIFSGDLIFQGASLKGLLTHLLAKKGISYVPQMGNVFADLTVMDNLHMAGYLIPKDEAKIKAEQMAVMFPVLKKFVHRKAGTLSGGERRMLAVAMGLMKNPKLMLLDELSTDLAPIIAEKVLQEVARLKNELGITVLLVEQMAKRALEIGDTAYLLVSGGVKYAGKASDLLQEPDLCSLYLGIKPSLLKSKSLELPSSAEGSG